MFMESFLVISFLCLFNISFQYFIVSSEIHFHRLKIVRVMRSLFQLYIHIISERDRIDYTFSYPIRFLMLSCIKFDHSNREISFYFIVNNFLHNAIIFVRVTSLVFV